MTDYFIYDRDCEMQVVNEQYVREFMKGVNDLEHKLRFEGDGAITVASGDESSVTFDADRKIYATRNWQDWDNRLTTDVNDPNAVQKVKSYLYGESNT